MLTNGKPTHATSIDRSSLIDPFDDAPMVPPPASVVALEDIVRVAQAGRRDVHTMRRLISRYDLNGADQYASAIASETLDAVREMAHAKRS